MISKLTTAWPRFRALPIWFQVAGWLFLWPALVALLLLSGGTARWRPLAAGTSFVILGFFWSAMCAGTFEGPSEVPEPPSETSVSSTSTLAATAVTASTTSTSAGTPAVAPTQTAAPPPTTVSAGEAVTTSATQTATSSLTSWEVTRIIDGDTLEVVVTDGAIETVRIIGIDTPERGECGFSEASDGLARLVLGHEVTLSPGAQDDRDRYGRILRYVDILGVDAGLELIRGGFAIARYDSRDGYGRHPREDLYVSADAASLPICAGQPAAPQTPTTTTPTPTAIPTASLTATPSPIATATAAAPSAYYANCTEARAAGVTPLYRGDPGYRSGLDRDNDGIACE